MLLNPHETEGFEKEVRDVLTAVLRSAAEFCLPLLSLMLIRDSLSVQNNIMLHTLKHSDKPMQAEMWVSNEQF